MQLSGMVVDEKVVAHLCSTPLHVQDNPVGFEGGSSAQVQHFYFSHVL